MKIIVSSWLLLSSALALALSVATFTRAADSSGAPATTTPSARPALRGDRALGPFSIFDTNHDGVLSADEINNAPAVLRKLDKNGDGQLTAAELRPNGPPPRRNGNGNGNGNGNNSGPGGPRADDRGDTPPPPPPEN